MSLTNFIPRETLVTAAWLNEVDATVQDAIDDPKVSQENVGVSVFDFFTEDEKIAVTTRTGINVTTNFKRAVASGKSLYINDGLYVLDDELVVNTTGQMFFGAGRSKTVIYQLTSSKKIFNVSGDFNVIQDLTLDYSFTPTSGGTAVFVSGTNFVGNRIRVNSCHKGIDFRKVTANVISCYLNDIQISNYVSSGISCNGCGDIFVSKFTIDAITSTNGTSGGIVLEDFCEAVCFSHGDVLNGAYSLYSNAAVYGAMLRPAYNRFTDVYFDTSVNGSYLNHSDDFVFNACWFSAGRTGAGNPGLTLASTKAITCIGTQFNNCGSHGLYASANTDRLRLTSCEALGNSVTAIGARGVLLDGATNTQIIGGIYSNYLFAGVQSYGIVIGATCTGTIIRGIDGDGNSAGAIFDASTDFATEIENCKGYNNVLSGAVITVGASPFNYLAGHTAEMVTIDSGTVSSISVAGQTLFTATGHTVMLKPNQLLTVTYTVIPTMKKVFQ